MSEKLMRNLTLVIFTWSGNSRDDGGINAFSTTVFVSH